MFKKKNDMIEFGQENKKISEQRNKDGIESTVSNSGDTIDIQSMVNAQNIEENIRETELRLTETENKGAYDESENEENISEKSTFQYRNKEQYYRGTTAKSRMIIRAIIMAIGLAIYFIRRMN